ncbi:MAG: MetQ/NlpA family ABC transporter substrate-binding protein [Candidatus Phytoplasma stylosanthis]|nr:MetQ/NlpA family ABC transporter substrate-binding protein [Candidatus Phytoplasma stylosanthis]
MTKLKNIINSKFTIYIFSFLVVTIFLFCIYSNKKNNKKEEKIEKIKIQTALRPVSDFLNEKIKPKLQEKGVELEVLHIESYTKNHYDLVNKKCDAKLDSHLPWSYFQNENKNIKTEIKVLSLLYFPKFAIYSLKESSINNEESLKNKFNRNEEIKMLLPEEKTQKTLALRLLENLKLIERKNDRKDDKLITKDKFQLSEQDFVIKSNIKMEFTNALTGFFNQFKDGNYDICCNYPKLLGNNNLQNFLNIISTIELNEDTEKNEEDYKDPLLPYIISIIVRKESLYQPKIQKLKEVFEDKEILKLYWEKEKEFACGLQKYDIQKVILNINNSQFQ